MVTDAESFELEAALRREAAGVRDDLELETRLRHIGVPVLVGSAAMHVMVRHDLDITTICTALDAATAVAITALGAALACDPGCGRCRSATTPGTGTSTPPTRTAGTSACTT